MLEIDDKACNFHWFINIARIIAIIIFYFNSKHFFNTNIKIDIKFPHDQDKKKNLWDEIKMLTHDWERERNYVIKM